MIAWNFFKKLRDCLRTHPVSSLAPWGERAGERGDQGRYCDRIGHSISSNINGLVFRQPLRLLGVPFLECLQVRVGGMHGWKSVARRPQLVIWCRRPESNRHGLRHYPLKIACLPIPPRRQRHQFFFDNPDEAKF